METLNNNNTTPIQKINNLTPTLFAQAIEKIVSEKKMNYIQAILHFCEENEIDLEAIPAFLNLTLKSKVQLDAEDLHYFPKSSKLPL